MWRIEHWIRRGFGCFRSRAADIPALLPEEERKATPMKRLLFLFLAACVLLTLVPGAMAAETEETRPANACGEDLTWAYENGVLTITGSGAMDDFNGDAPWLDLSQNIQKVVLSGSVTTVGTDAFAGYKNLTEVDFGGSLKEIGIGAFRGCTGLETISLPTGFHRFGASCFEGCTSLMEVYCAGGMPSFNMNCLWNGSSITVYCPADNLWGEKYVEELETNFGGRLQVLADDGTDPYNFDEETEETTQPTTEETIPPTTEQTVPPTTQETAPPTTEETTVPATTAAETTQPTFDTQEPTQSAEASEQDGGSPLMKIFVGILVISGVLTVVLVALLIRGGKRGGKDSE